MLNRVEEEIPSASDVAKADDIEHQEITESATKSMENLITQFEGQETLPMRGSLKVEVVKRVQLEESIKKEKCKLKEIRDYPEVYDNGIQEDIKK